MTAVDLPMTSRGDEVKHSVNSVISKSRVTLDSRLLGQDVIVLALEVAENFGKAGAWVRMVFQKGLLHASYLASLSIESPNPGVSTMVREMRVPSSSSSSSMTVVRWEVICRCGSFFSSCTHRLWRA